MDLDLDDLRAQAETWRKQPASGTAALVHDLRRHTELRDFVTLETTALAPVPHLAVEGLQLISLLAVVETASLEQVQYRPAWGALAWSWPARQVQRRYDFDQDVDPELAAGVARYREPGSGWLAPSPVAAAEDFDALFSQLDDLLEGPWPPDHEGLTVLATRYRRLLPPNAIGLLGKLAADTDTWLISTGGDADIEETPGSEPDGDDG